MMKILMMDKLVTDVVVEGELLKYENINKFENNKKEIYLNIFCIFGNNFGSLISISPICL